MNNLQITMFPEDTNGTVVSNGLIRVSSTNEENGSIFLTSEEEVWKDSSVFIEKRTAFFRGPIALLEKLIQKAVNGNFNTIKEHKIVKEQSFEPFWENQSPVQYNEDGELKTYTIDGLPVYQQTLAVSDLSREDKLVPSESAIIEVATPSAETIAVE